MPVREIRRISSWLLALQSVESGQNPADFAKIRPEILSPVVRRHEKSAIRESVDLADRVRSRGFKWRLGDKLGEACVQLLTNADQPDQKTQYTKLLQAIDPNSSTERTFIDYLYENNLRLPDAAQKNVDGIYCRPDFYYYPNVWIFCDGSPHDDPEVQKRDQEQRQLLWDRGEQVWVWHYREDLAAKVAKRPDIFRSVR